jgi:hypothetical protein
MQKRLKQDGWNSWPMAVDATGLSEVSNWDQLCARIRASIKGVSSSERLFHYMPLSGPMAARR